MLLVFEVTTWFLENQEKIKRMTSGYSTSIVPSRDFESERSHVLFGYFSFIILDTWLPHHFSFGMTVDILYIHTGT